MKIQIYFFTKAQEDGGEEISLERGDQRLAGSWSRASIRHGIISTQSHIEYNPMCEMN